MNMNEILLKWKACKENLSIRNHMEKIRAKREKDYTDHLEVEQRLREVCTEWSTSIETKKEEREERIQEVDPGQHSLALDFADRIIGFFHPKSDEKEIEKHPAKFQIIEVPARVRAYFK